MEFYQYVILAILGIYAMFMISLMRKKTTGSLEIKEEKIEKKIEEPKLTKTQIQTEKILSGELEEVSCPSCGFNVIPKIENNIPVCPKCNRVLE